MPVQRWMRTSQPSPNLLDSPAEDSLVAPHTMETLVSFVFRVFVVQMQTNAVLSAPSLAGVMTWAMKLLTHPPSVSAGDSVGPHEVNCVREIEAMGPHICGVS